MEYKNSKLSYFALDLIEFVRCIISVEFTKMKSATATLAIMVSIYITSSFSCVAESQSVIRLTEIEGRSWLITADGKPFFAHGITHVSNGELRNNYGAVSKACKDLGFNAYGYGCPTELKSDMPYLDGRNYVPISMYLGRGFRFIDIFDPWVQKRLREQVKLRCLENRDNPNLIGYYWTDLAAWPLK